MRIKPALILILMLPLASQARSVAVEGNPNACEDGMRKNVSISINFNGQEKSLAAARAAIDSQRNALDAAAKKAGLTIEPNNYNYNVSVNNNYYNGTAVQNYNFSGSLNYQLTSEEVAKKLGEQLDEQKRQFSINVNASKCNG